MVTFNHLKTNSAKFAHYKFKIRKVIEFFYCQSLMQHLLYVFVFLTEFLDLRRAVVSQRYLAGGVLIYQVQSGKVRSV